MVWSGYFMCNEVLEKQGFEEPIIEVLTSVTDDGSGGTEFAEDVGLDEFYHNLVIIGLGGHDFYPFGDIIHSYQDILIPKRQWEGSNEIDTSVLHKFKCTRQLHESLSSIAGVQVRGRIPQRIGFVKINF
jgi:hypothetical protein